MAVWEGKGPMSIPIYAEGCLTGNTFARSGTYLNIAIYLSVCRSIYLSIYLSKSIYLSIYLSLSLSFYQSISQSI